MLKNADTGYGEQLSFRVAVYDARDGNVNTKPAWYTDFQAKQLRTTLESHFYTSINWL